MKFEIFEYLRLTHSKSRCKEFEQQFVGVLFLMLGRYFTIRWSLIFNARKVFFTLQMLSQALVANLLAVKMPRIHNFLKL